jgi:uncharacterized membrane protein
MQILSILFLCLAIACFICAICASILKRDFEGWFAAFCGWVAAYILSTMI